LTQRVFPSLRNRSPLHRSNSPRAISDSAAACTRWMSYLIESSNPKVRGYDGAAMSFVDYLYALAE